MVSHHDRNGLFPLPLTYYLGPHHGYIQFSGILEDSPIMYTALKLRISKINKALHL